MEPRTYSPQEAAWRGLFTEYGATGMRRTVDKHGVIRLRLFDHAQGNQPTHQFDIDPKGRVSEILMAPLAS